MNRGLGLIEVLVAAALLGLVAILGTSAYLSFDRSSAGVFRKLDEARLAHNFHQLALQPQVVQELLLNYGRNPAFENCLRRGRCPEQPQPLTIGGADWAFSQERVALSFRGLPGDLVELKLAFLRREGQSPLTIWLSRYDYVQDPVRRLTQIGCARPNAIIGVDFASLTAVCGPVANGGPR